MQSSRKNWLKYHAEVAVLWLIVSIRIPHGPQPVVVAVAALCLWHPLCIKGCLVQLLAQQDPPEEQENAPAGKCHMHYWNVCFYQDSSNYTLPLYSIAWVLTVPL